ncbi:Beta-glucosidase [Beutenbergia cavernae DSM 12333]|uniref:Beta-glucosidase n=1 Tax=Beutenbergia cavernae (strain ATCC BAA-8 / DSM 12333 / CCUG 43141 / JCM 11478 / NBRC 16432 / NCIMB 13614 / HKI 0122) TaxID=471853 RepID=C5C1V9_BEUC1|nr:glycoside hydrolase family 3 C-terminal domain-containing protein [Beutenbergia cavernae]ACQ79577.1 Beta-glucosidase [Beutenbergia cavernae DSM 12333]
MADDARPAFRDPSLSADVRARDLAARLTQAEKIAMLHQYAPAVPRLGLAAFRTGTEALHGLAWLGTATTFPQAVGLAATWDADLVRRVGAAVGTEVRARHAIDPTVSLQVWAPVVNPLRHPRWGRNEEGYSEDPHVTAWLATAYARGLRGDHPTYWRTVPTLKHLVGYGAETHRALTNAQLRPRVLREYELPAFRGPIEAGVVGAVMPSYNLVNGRPAHLAADIIAELRSCGPHEVVVVSDAGAPSNLSGIQRWCTDPVEARAAALRAGIDSFTDDDADAAPTLAHLTAALDRGLITQEVVDAAVRRQLAWRIRTGELDPGLDPWAGTGPEALDAPAHRTLAREAATAAVVVLANDGLLPLERAATVAVVGPHADTVLRDWYSGAAPYTIGIATALAESHGVTTCDGADRVALRCVTTGGYVRTAESGVLVADAADAAAPEAAFDVTDWGDGVLTFRSVATGLLAGGGWPLRAQAEHVDGWVVQETWQVHVHDDGSWSLLHLGSGRWVAAADDGTLVAEAPSPELATRFVRRMLRAGHEAVARAAAAADVVVVTLGNDPHLLGRETEDRPHLRLPSPQTELWRAASEANPRALAVIVSSYPYVLADDLRTARAVVWSSHAGQELGHGVADVLTGAAEPSGRLAQAWPEAEEDAGDLVDHDIIAGGLTSWYASAAPRFALGHGLTYSSVTYDALDAPAALEGAQHDDVVAVSVRVSNTGERPAHELVQVYASALEHRLPVPRRRIVAHRRVTLAPGTSRDVELRFRLADLAVWDVGHERWVVEPGRYLLAAGTGEQDLPLRHELRVTGAPVAPRAATSLGAAAFDDAAHVVLTERTPLAGAAVEVAPGRGEGWVAWWAVDLDGVGPLTIEVARDGVGPAGVRIETREPGSPWARYAQAQVPLEGGRHDVVALVPSAAEAPKGVRDVRTVLTGSARLIALRPAAPEEIPRDDDR